MTSETWEAVQPVRSSRANTEDIYITGSGGRQWSVVSFVALQSQIGMAVLKHY